MRCMRSDVSLLALPWVLRAGRCANVFRSLGMRTLLEPGAPHNRACTLCANQTRAALVNMYCMHFALRLCKIQSITRKRPSWTFLVTNLHINGHENTECFTSCYTHVA